MSYTVHFFPLYGKVVINGKTETLTELLKKDKTKEEQKILETLQCLEKRNIENVMIKTSDQKFWKQN